MTIWKSKRLSWVVQAVVAMVLISIAPMARATTDVPNATTNLQAGSSWAPADYFGSITGCGGACTSTADLVGPQAWVTGTGSGAQSSAVIDVYFEITGAPGTYIPIVIDGGYYLTVAGSGVSSSVSVNLQPDNFPLLNDRLFSQSCNTQCSMSGPFRAYDTVDSNSLYDLRLIASGGNSTGTNIGSYDTWGDPTITIDPSFVNAADYSITISPNVTQPVPTPEPGGLWLLGSALSALALVVPRARTR